MLIAHFPAVHASYMLHTSLNMSRAGWGSPSNFEHVFGARAGRTKNITFPQLFGEW